MKNKKPQEICPDCELPYTYHWKNWVDSLAKKMLPHFLPKKIEKMVSWLIEKIFSITRLTHFETDFDEGNLPLRSSFFIQEARKKGLKPSAQKGPYGYTGNIKLSFNNKEIDFFGLPLTNISQDKKSILVDDKIKVKRELEKNGFPVVCGKSFWFFQKKKAIDYGINRIGYPLVVKSTNGSVSRHVTTNIRDKTELKKAIQKVTSFSSNFIIEKYLDRSFVFRATVIGKEKVFCVKQIPANITGDGISKLSQLIEKKNQDPKRNIKNKNESLFSPILINKVTEELLREKNYHQGTILPQGELVYLQKDPFLKIGADLMEVTEHIHPDNSDLFKKIARHFDLELVGIDFIAGDIGKSWKNQACAILELNSLPCIELHYSPNIGKSKNTALALLEQTLKYYQ